MINVSNNTHWLLEQSNFFPDKTALIFPNTTLSFKEFYDLSIIFSNYLKTLGVKENDHVGILSNHNVNFWISINAIWLLSAIPVTLNSRNTHEEIFEQLNHAEVRFLIVDEDFQFISIQQFAAFSSTIKIIRVNWEKLEGQNHKSELPSFNIHNPALILFTSGSSGKSKAVVHTFKSLYESVKAMDSVFNLSPQDVWLASLPLYHIGGFMVLVRSLLSGALSAFPPSLNYNDIIKSIRDYNPTHLSFVPTTMIRILDAKVHPNKNIKQLYLGGGPSTRGLIEEAVEAGWPIIKVYGSTETCSMVTVLMPEDLKNKIESAGKVIGQNRLLIKEDQILVRSGSLFKEYYNDQQTTNDKLVDGIYYSGDYGWIDDEGFLFVESRREDIIITGGENVSVNEIETALKAINKLKDAFVFPLEDEIWGQIICAAVVGNEITEDELRIILRENMAAYKIPKRFYFVSAIPRNEMGKINRSELYKILSLNEN